MEKNNVRIPLKQYVEFHFMKFNNLSTMHLSMLIHPKLESTLSFKKLQSSISIILTKLKKQGKIEKVGNKEWKWVE